MTQYYNLYKMCAIAQWARCKWLPHLLVEQHPDQESERVFGEQRVGLGVSGDMQFGHAPSLPGAAFIRHTLVGVTTFRGLQVGDAARELGEGRLHRLELGYRANNPGSAAVARAAGFVREGLEREKFLVDLPADNPIRRSAVAA